MKSLKPILISLGVIAAVVVALILLIFVFPSTTQADTDEAEASASTSAEVYVINEQYEDLVSFDILPTDGTAMHVDITQGDSTPTFEVTPKTDFFDYDRSTLRSMMYTVTSITAKSVVDDSNPDLEAYGLAEPWHTVRTTYADGHVDELYLGGSTPTDGNYYCKTNLSDSIYVIGGYLVSLLTRSDIEYRDITLFPTYEDDDVYTNINWVCLTQKDGTNIELVLDSDQTQDCNTAGSMYAMLQPKQASGNDEVIKTNIMDVVATISKEAIIADVTDDELADYGLDNPARLQMTDTSGNSLDLLIGSTCPNDEYTYCMVNGSKTVLTCLTSSCTWLSQNYMELMIRTMWYHSIKDVASIAYNIEGTEHEMDFEHYVTKNANGDDADGINATLDGQDITETNARRLFVRTLNFRVAGDLDADYTPSDEAGDITITMLDGTTYNMKLYPINDRQYAAEVDGELKSYVYKKNFETLKSAITDVLAGNDLDFSFNS